MNKQPKEDWMNISDKPPVIPATIVRSGDSRLKGLLAIAIGGCVVLLTVIGWLVMKDRETVEAKPPIPPVVSTDALPMTDVQKARMEAAIAEQTRQAVEAFKQQSAMDAARAARQEQLVDKHRPRFFEVAMIRVKQTDSDFANVFFKVTNQTDEFVPSAFIDVAIYTGPDDSDIVYTGLLHVENANPGDTITSELGVGDLPRIIPKESWRFEAKADTYQSRDGQERNPTILAIDLK